MKQEKKSYRLCSKCGTYTRAVEYLKQYGAVRAVSWVNPWISDSLATRQIKKCRKCGTTSGFTKVYLQTEIDDSGNELAFFQPDGAKVELKKQNLE